MTVLTQKGPLSLVLAELEAGTPTLAAIVAGTGLSESVVRAAVDHLTRSGRVQAREMTMGCPASGCGGCAAAAPDGGPGCGRTASPIPGRRPGLVVLTLTRS